MSEQKDRLARKNLLIQRLRKTTNFSVNMEELLELVGIVAEETIEAYDQRGFFDHCDSCGGPVE